MGLRDKAKQKKDVEIPVEVSGKDTSTPEAMVGKEHSLRERAKAISSEAGAPQVDQAGAGNGKLQRDDLINHMRNKVKVQPSEAEVAAPHILKDKGIEPEEIIENTEESEKPDEGAENREDFIKRMSGHRESTDLVRKAYGLKGPKREDALKRDAEPGVESAEDKQTTEYNEKLFDRIVKTADSRDAVFKLASRQISEEKLEEIAEKTETEAELQPDTEGTPEVSSAKQAVFELMEERAAEDISSRLRRIQQEQRKE
ncbi:MAG: hypothetical protein KAH86_07770, partial [Methanosarcinales archaeon]|nr:hypothetical protein [Methanosarcinales archaeon]